MGALATKTEGLLVIPERFHQRCVENDDQLDALVCAFIARVAMSGKLQAIPEGSRSAAAREGWIDLPHDGMSLAAALSSSEAPGDSEAAQ